MTDVACVTEIFCGGTIASKRKVVLSRGIEKKTRRT